jgi:hypothetical protein
MKRGGNVCLFKCPTKVKLKGLMLQLTESYFFINSLY